MTLKEAKAQAKFWGFSLNPTKFDPNEFRLAPCGMTPQRAEDCAYYTNDLEDAVMTARWEGMRQATRNGFGL